MSEKCPFCDSAMQEDLGDFKTWKCLTRDDQGELHQSPFCEAKVIAAERDRLKRAIESFGSGADFDWNVLARIDEQEQLISTLTAERDAALLDAELLDFMAHFHVDAVEKRNGWTVLSVNRAFLELAGTHGPWDSPRDALSACRELALKEWGWANRPTK